MKQLENMTRKTIEKVKKPVRQDREVTFREYIDDVEELASYYMGDISVSLEQLQKEHPEIMTKYTDQSDLVKDTLVENVNSKIHAF